MAGFRLAVYSLYRSLDCQPFNVEGLALRNHRTRRRRHIVGRVILTSALACGVAVFQNVRPADAHANRIYPRHSPAHQNLRHYVRANWPHYRRPREVEPSNTLAGDFSGQSRSEHHDRTAGRSLDSGIASVYSGGRTASGETMNPSAMTAAHRTLPFGTNVTVVNNTNGRTVVVRINDRGPFVHGRVIDLSPAAAHAIGMNGIAPVTLTVGGRG
jgi:rare lipoprotein A